jgi:hypothetical protein
MLSMFTNFRREDGDLQNARAGLPYILPGHFSPMWPLGGGII